MKRGQFLKRALGVSAVAAAPTLLTHEELTALEWNNPEFLSALGRYARWTPRVLQYLADSSLVVARRTNKTPCPSCASTDFVYRWAEPETLGADKGDIWYCLCGWSELPETEEWSVGDHGDNGYNRPTLGGPSPRDAVHRDRRYR